MDNNESPTFDRRSKKIRRKDQEAIKRLAQKLKNVKNDSQSSSDFTQENFYDKEYRLGVDLDLPEIFNMKPFELVTTGDIAKGEIIVSGFPLLDQEFVKEDKLLKKLVDESTFFASKVYQSTRMKKFIPNLYIDERSEENKSLKYVPSLIVMFASTNIEDFNSELKNPKYIVKRDQINHIAIDLVASRNLVQGEKIVVNPYFVNDSNLTQGLGCAFLDVINLKENSKFGRNNILLNSYKGNNPSERKLSYLAKQLQKKSTLVGNKVKIIGETAPQSTTLKASSVGYIVKYIV